MNEYEQYEIKLKKEIEILIAYKIKYDKKLYTDREHHISNLKHRLWQSKL